MFGAKLPAIFLGQLRDIHFANIQQRTQRQGDRAPRRMRHHQRDCDPVVAIEPFAIGRPRRRVMMHAGPLDVGTVTLRRTIIDGDHEAAVGTGVKLGRDQLQHFRRQLAGVPTDADEAVVEAIPIVQHAGRRKPGAGGAPIISQDHPRDDDAQAKRNPRIKGRRQRRHEGRQSADERKPGLRRLATLRIGPFQPTPLVVTRRRGFFATDLRPFRLSIILSHPWLLDR